MMDKREKIRWSIIAFAAIFLIILTFTPLVLAPEKINPKLISMPYTLWMGILISIALVVLTYLGGKILLKDKE